MKDSTCNFCDRPFREDDNPGEGNTVCRFCGVIYHSGEPIRVRSSTKGYYRWLAIPEGCLFILEGKEL